MEKKKWLDSFLTPEDGDDTDGTAEINNSDVDIPVVAETTSSSALTYRFRLFCPQSYNEASRIADVLKQKSGVIVNLQHMDREFSQRMIDFLSGVVYCENGRIEKIGHRVILCVPNDGDVAGKITL